VIAYGMWAGALLSALIGTRLPGPGSIYLGQTLKFRAPVRIGDTLTITVTVTVRDETTRWVRLACSGVNQDGQVVIEGDAEVTAPDERIEPPRATLPEVCLRLGCSGLQLGAIRMAAVIRGGLRTKRRISHYMGDAASAGIVLGAKVPVVLTSRADSCESRIASCAIALMLAQHYRGTPP
jgi:hypothetical protein